MFKKSRSNQVRKRPDLQQRASGNKRYVDYYRSKQPEVVVKKAKDVFSKRIVGRQVTSNARSLPTYIALGIIVLCVGYIVTLNGRVSVVLGNQDSLRQPTYYREVINNILSQQLTSKTKISLDTHAFKEKILIALPEVKDATIAIPLVSRQVTVGLSFVTPSYVYTVNNTDYIVGSNGVILAEVKDLDAAKVQGLRRITDLAPLNVRVGQTVLLSSDIAFIDTVFKQLAAVNKEIETITLPQGAGELFVKLQNVPYSIKFSLLTDVNQQVGAYIATINQLQKEGALPVEYIDVRLAERVFVK